MSNKPYYVLVIKGPDSNWGVEFGDYERETVEFEQMTYEDTGYYTKIIRTTEDQKSIDLAVSQLNNNN